VQNLLFAGYIYILEYTPEYMYKIHVKLITQFAANETTHFLSLTCQNGRCCRTQFRAWLYMLLQQQPRSAGLPRALRSNLCLQQLPSTPLLLCSVWIE
jgi:hypothetical protein